MASYRIFLILPLILLASLIALAGVGFALRKKYEPLATVDHVDLNKY